MFACVPDLDVGSSELGYLHSSSSGRRKRKVMAACDKGEEKYSSAMKENVGVRIADKVSGMEAESEEKYAHTSAMNRASTSPVDVPLGQMPFHEDEMLTWIQYPLDDSFSKSYCVEQLYEPPLMPYPAQCAISGSISQDSAKLYSTGFSSQLLEFSDSSVGIQMLTPDVAMAMGAHRAAGLLPQDGAEAFNTVQTKTQSSPNTCSSKAVDPHNVEVNHTGNQNVRNFPFFSQHAAAMKTSLQILGASSGPSSKGRFKRPLNTEAKEKSPFVEQSMGTATLTSLSPCGESYLSEWGRNTTQLTYKNVQQKSTDPLHCLHKAGKAKMDISAKSAAGESEIVETGDVTMTSLSDGSDYSSEKSVKEMADLSCKSKSFHAREFECDSKDARGATSQEKDSPLKPSNSAKRSRAAEIHNQSERRRRNKINDKMRALQELIPNANKTDKASMLDEAIEYVKMLQAQLQLMSLRTGMMIPPVMMPPGMQYLALPQTPGPAQANMGSGFSWGGVTDASHSSVGGLHRPGFFGQPTPGQAYHLTGHQPSGSPLVLHEVPSSTNPTPRHSVSVFQQPQLLHMPRTASIYKGHMHANPDSQKHL